MKGYKLLFVRAFHITQAYFISLVKDKWRKHFPGTLIFRGLAWLTSAKVFSLIIFTGQSGQPLRHFSGLLVFLLAWSQWTTIKIEPCFMLYPTVAVLVNINSKEVYKDTMYLICFDSRKVFLAGYSTGRRMGQNLSGRILQVRIVWYLFRLHKTLKTKQTKTSGLEAQSLSWTKTKSKG